MLNEYSISFIIIAKNEEFGIVKCLNALLKIDNEKSEVICVDSGSDDNTLNIMKDYKEKFRNFKLFSLGGNSNPAIARNVGIKSADNDFIFFIDGDIEPNISFIDKALNELENENVAAVIGKLKEISYGENYTTIIEQIDDRFNIKQKKRIYSSGGMFIIKKESVNTAGLFNENLVRNEDIDFQLRVTENKTMVAIPVLMGTHHTIPYQDKERLKENIFDFHGYYLKAIVKNITTNFKGVIINLFKNSGYTYGLIIFFLVFATLILKSSLLFNLIIILILFDIAFGILRKKNLKYRLYLHYMAFVLSLIGLFQPDKRKKYTVIEL
jgi:glycosyltransferase involved in cell wall biosynthesis